jgi:hypothetical protein
MKEKGTYPFLSYYKSFLGIEVHGARATTRIAERIIIKCYRPIGERTCDG